MPGRMLGVRHPGQHSRFDERVEPVIQDVSGDPEAALQVVEPGDAEKRVADDEHAPPLPDDLEALGDGAVHPGEALAVHALRIVSCIIERKSVTSST